MRFSWNENYAVGHDEIDAQHQTLFAVVDELAQQVIVQGIKQLSVAQIDLLGSYGALHFATEEAIIAACSPSQLAEHQKLHAEFTAMVALWKQMSDRNEKVSALAALSWLQDWVLTHVLKADQDIKNLGPHSRGFRKTA